MPQTRHADTCGRSSCAQHNDDMQYVPYYLRYAQHNDDTPLAVGEGISSASGWPLLRGGIAGAARMAHLAGLA
jgi:hypothetical protein